MARPSASETVFIGKSKPPEAAPLCGWREPETDLKSFFPGATRWELEQHALSGERIQLAQQLARPLLPEENLLHLYRVCSNTEHIGVVMTRRIKGAHGAIEIVIAANPSGELCGLRLQRMREPEEIAAALDNAHWLSSFHGKTTASAWQIGTDIPDVPAEARSCAAAIVDGVRSSMILLSAVDRPRDHALQKSPHH